MTSRRRLVRVPASSGNLGPGYDVLGAALALHLELEVSEAGSFSIDPGDDSLPADRGNLIVRSFERLHPAEGIRFEVRNEIPTARGLGSSAAATVAGLLAADHLFELGHSREEIYTLACEIEGHPDNVAAALYGGIVACVPEGAPVTAPADPASIALGGAGAAGRAPGPIRLAPPEGVDVIAVIPSEEVPTPRARAAVPEAVPTPDAVHNLGALAHLLLGIERSDLTLIERGLADRIHQPRRRPLYARSMELVEEVRSLGALGATISGAGPTVLVWAFWQSGSELLARLEERAAGWAQVRRAPFDPLGADVPEL